MKQYNCISPAQKYQKCAGLVLDKILENIEISTTLNNYRTNDVSVRTNWTVLIQNQSENKIWLIFLLSKNNIRIIQTKGWCKKMKIIKQELQFEECLKQRIEFICEFSEVSPTFINGSIRKLEKTNITYIEPHRVIIKNITFLVFNYSNDVYITNLTKKIKLSELEK